MIKTYFLQEINSLNIPIKKGSIIFLNGDLASGKTTLTKHIINNLLNINESIISPTYTYYNKYGENIYHFDLYRINNYDEFFAIGGEEILSNPENISIIEWPGVLKDYFKPNIEIFLKNTKNQNEREINIIILE